jgi:hypothetical protein
MVRCRGFTNRDKDMTALLEGEAGCSVQGFCDKWGMRLDQLGVVRVKLNKKRERMGLPPLPALAVGWRKYDKYHGLDVKAVVVTQDSDDDYDPEDVARELWEGWRRETNKYIQKEKNQYKKGLRIDTGVPIGIGIFGDPHIDSLGCDIAAIEADAKLIADTPWAYGGIPGDLNDYSRLQKFGAMNNQPPPNLGSALILYFMKLFHGKLLFAMTGNHDEWITRCSSFEPLREISKKVKARFSNYRMHLDLIVGKEKYVIFSQHQYLYNSTLNLSHGVFRMIERCDACPADIDVGIIAHSHVRDIEIRERKGRRVIALRPGTYKVVDKLFARKGMNSHRGGVGIVLWPDEHRVEAFDSIKNMCEFLNILRKAV